DYGIIEYPDTTLQDNLNVSVGSPVPMQPEFGNLMSQWAANTPTGVSLAAYTPTIQSMACPATTQGTWDISGNVVLPDTPTEQSPSPTISGTASLLPFSFISDFLGLSGASGSSGSSSNST